MGIPPIRSATITVKFHNMEPIDIQINPLDSIEMLRHAERWQESVRNLQHHTEDNPSLTDTSLEEAFRLDYARFLDVTALNLSSIAVHYRDMNRTIP